MAYSDNNRLRRINIPTPNADMAKFLKSAACRAEVEKVTTRIFSYYYNSLPESQVDPKKPGSGQQNLKNGADYWIDIGGWGTEKDRWFGWITNDALSYNDTKGKRYPRVIEYGNPRLRIPAGRQLRNAAAEVSGQVSRGEYSIAGVQYDERGRGSRLRDNSGRFVRNPLAADSPGKRRRRP